MKRKKLNFPVCLVLFSLSLLLLLPISAIAEGDGAWQTDGSPYANYILLVEVGAITTARDHLVMAAFTLEKLDSAGLYWGPLSAGGTYKLQCLNEYSDMIATFQFISDTEATVTVESCSKNCLWPTGKAVTLYKIFGD